MDSAYTGTSIFPTLGHQQCWCLGLRSPTASTMDLNLLHHPPSHAHVSVLCAPGSVSRENLDKYRKQPQHFGDLAQHIFIA